MTRYGKLAGFVAMVTLLSAVSRSFDMIDDFYLMTTMDEWLGGSDPSEFVPDPLGAEDLRLGEISQVVFRGEWKSEKPAQADFLPTKTGSFLIYFYQELDKQKDFELHVKLYENDLIENKNFEVTMNMSFSDRNQTEFKAVGPVKIEKADHIFEEKGTLTCTAEVTVQIFDKSGKPLPVSTDLLPGINLKGALRSGDCQNLSFDFGADLDNSELPVALFGMVIWSALIVLTIKPMLGSFLGNYQRILNLSKEALLGNLAGDFLLVFLNVLFTMTSYSQFFEFSVIVGMFLMTSIMVKIRVYFLAVQACLEAKGLSQEQIRRQTVKESIMVFMVVFGTLFLSVMFIQHYYLFVLLMVYPVFQIAHNYSKVMQKNCFDYQLHVPLFVSQIWFPIFLRGYSRKVVRLATDYQFISVLLAELTFFLLALWLQKMLGPRFFVPKRWRSGYYQYERKIAPEMDAQGEACPICFQSLSHSPTHEESNGNAEILLKTYMKTPCGHDFHKQCLQQWMELRMTCPCCRKEVPPYE